MADSWWFPGVLITAVIAALCAFAALIIQEERAWQDFAAKHKCVVVGQKAAQLYNTVSVDSKGMPVVGVATLPAQTAYQCDDGVTYWR